MRPINFSDMFFDLFGCSGNIDGIFSLFQRATPATSIYYILLWNLELTAQDTQSQMNDTSALFTKNLLSNGTKIQNK